MSSRAETEARTAHRSDEKRETRQLWSTRCNTRWHAQAGKPEKTKLAAFKTDFTSNFPHKYLRTPPPFTFSARLSAGFVIVPFSIHRLIFFFHRSNRSSPKTLFLAQHVFDWPARYFIKATFHCIKYSSARQKFPVPVKTMCQAFA